MTAPRRHRPKPVVPILAAALLLTATAAPSPTVVGDAVDVVTPRLLRAHLGFIAADELRGRRTPSRGLKIAARYIASQLERVGAGPAGDPGNYLQRIDLERARIDEEATGAQIAGRDWDYGEDFIATVTSGGQARGRPLYVGHGWVVRSLDIDPYAGLEVEGRILVVRGAGLPAGVGAADLAAGRRGEDWLSPVDYAVRHGAAGIVSLPTDSALRSWELTRRGNREGIVRVSGWEDDRGNGRIPAILVAEPVARALFTGEPVEAEEILASPDVGSFLLSENKEIDFSVRLREEAIFTHNVVAVLEGSDPELRHQYVALGAHYDHVGVGSPDDSGDAIYNGADDDGSGTVALLALAEAFAGAPRPARSLLFVWHAGEESGMWGSRHFVDNPSVPLEAIVAQLNIDMIGRSSRPGDDGPANEPLTGPREVYVIGPGIMSADLGGLIEEVNDRYLDLELDREYDDRDHPDRFFFRSDHYQYARAGIPVAFFFTGTHEDYHRPSDHVERIDFDKLARVTRTIGAVARAIADRPEPIRVDPDFR